METANVNLKNWKTLIKPGKLDINLNDDKSYAKIVAEPLENETINIGELLAQSLAIAVKPWPRSPEAPKTYTSGEELPDHPFAGLAALKRQPPK